MKGSSNLLHTVATKHNFTKWMQLYKQKWVISQYWKNILTFKALNSFDTRKIFRKHFNDTTNINDTLENNHLFRGQSNGQRDNICLALVLFPRGTIYWPTYDALHLACVYCQAINKLELL